MNLLDFAKKLQKDIATLNRRVMALASSPGGGGEANTASNVGTAGVGPFDAKVGVDLQFRKINAGSTKISVALDAPNKEVDIDVVPGNITHGSLGGVTSDQHHARDHAATHGPAAADALKLDDLAAPDDNTDLNALTTKHGLLKKLSNNPYEFLDGQGNWSVPVGTGIAIPHPTVRKITYQVADSDSGFSGIGSDSRGGSGSFSTIIDADGRWLRARTGTTIGNNAGQFDNNRQLYWMQHNLRQYWQIKTAADLTSQRIWLGISSTGMNTSDTATGHFLGLRYSAALSGNWYYIERNNTTGIQTATDSGILVVASTIYNVAIIVAADGLSAVIYINGAASGTLNTSLPSVSTDLGWVFNVQTTVAAAREMFWAYVYAETQ